MPQGSTTLHESEEQLTVATRDMHRAIVSLMEELEAVDWYGQRADATQDGELREILLHNRDGRAGARGDGPRVDPPSRSHLRGQAPGVPLHRGFDRGT